jgi:hypothetical protein
MRKTVIGALALGVVALAGCATAPVIKTASTPSGTSYTAPPFSASAPATDAPTSQTVDNTGPLGTSFEVTTQDNNGANVTYDVTATKVDQHAPLGAYESLTNGSDHLAAVRFTIKGVSGQESDDANTDAVTIGTDTTEYSFSSVSTADGGNFSYGEFKVSPGQVVSGWVTFELPAGQQVTSVQWQPGFNSGAATWTV